jgi:O-antigen/teichoic acid export membrane protein
VIFVGILPVAVLRLFGATAAGVYAVSDRLTWAALTVFTSLLLPLLSGATAVRTRGSKHEIQRLAEKGFKVTLALTVPALAFVAVFGNDIITAWTGRTDGLFKTALWLVCAAALFRSVSLLCLVLYRAAGGASRDLVRQSVRIVGALLAAVVAQYWGFHSLLAGFAIAELAAMIWMFSAVEKQTHGLNVRFLAPDAAKIALSAALTIAGILLISSLPVLAADGSRSKALVRVAVIVLTGAALGWPALLLTKFISKSEQSEVLGFFLQYRRKGLAAAQDSQ